MDDTVKITGHEAIMYDVASRHGRGEYASTLDGVIAFGRTRSEAERNLERLLARRGGAERQPGARPSCSAVTHRASLFRASGHVEVLP